MLSELRRVVSEDFANCLSNVAFNDVIVSAVFEDSGTDVKRLDLGVPPLKLGDGAFDLPNRDEVARLYWQLRESPCHCELLWCLLVNAYGTAYTRGRRQTVTTSQFATESRSPHPGSR